MCLVLNLGLSKCAATVSLTSAADQETIRWFDIWAAAVAADTSE